MSEWFFTSDLHGQGAFYEQLLALVAERGPAVALIGGDLAPHGAGDEGVRRQRLFLEGMLVEFARRLRDASPRTALLLMMGNDDWAANEDVLERHEGDLWRTLHERVVEVDGVAVAGCSWVPITPFGIKDWERWEDGGEETAPRLEGWTSRGGRLAPMRFDPAHRSPSIAGSLAALAARTTAGGTVWVSHGPPRGTRCDVLNGGAHVGSRALRRFLERHQPPLLLSGHIHEAARVSGAYHDLIGRTVVVNPGQFGTTRLCGVWFDPRRVAATLRHTVHG